MAVFERLLLAQDVAIAAANARGATPCRSDSLARRSFVTLGTVGADGSIVAAIGKPQLPPLAPEALDRLAQGKPVAVATRRAASRSVSLVVPARPRGPPHPVVGELSPEYLWGAVDLYPAATDFCIFEHGTRIVLFCSMPDHGGLAAVADSATNQTRLQSVRWERDGEHQRAHRVGPVHARRVRHAPTGSSWRPSPRASSSRR